MFNKPIFLDITPGKSRILAIQIIIDDFINITHTIVLIKH